MGGARIHGSGGRRPRGALARRALTSAAALALIGCGGQGGDAASGVSVVRVAPFVVEPADGHGEEVGRAAAGSLATRLADLDGIREARVAEDPGVGGVPELVLQGSLSLGADAATLRLRVATPGRSGPDRTLEVAEPSGDLAVLASEAARDLAALLGRGPSGRYRYIADVTGGADVDRGAVRDVARAVVLGADSEVAIEEAARIVELHPEDADVRLLHAWAILRGWDAEPSRKDLLESLRLALDDIDRIDPASPHDELIRAYVYRSSGQPEQARALYDDVLARDDLADPLRSWALRQRAYAVLQVGEADRAALDAEAAVTLDPANAMSLVALGKALETLGLFDEAILRSEQALALQPGSWRHHQRLGLLLARAKRYDAAVDSLERSCAMSGAQEVCANLAVTLERAGRTSESDVAATHAAALPETRWGRYNLACHAALRDDRERAFEDLRRAVDLGFADALIRTDPDLEPLRGLPAMTEIVREIEDRLSTRRRLSMSAFPWQA